MQRRGLLVLLSLWLGLAGAAPAAQSPAAAATVPLAVRGMPDRAPLRVSAARKGLSLEIDVRLQPGWHLYGRDTGGGQPVAIEIVEGAFVAAGALEMPMDEHGLITGDARLRLPLRRAGPGAGLLARMRFLACDALECLPPITLDLATPNDTAAPAEPVKVLLVAVDESERTTRIAGFLRERGFAPTVTTYATVTAATCDAHDVVLADSPTFRQTKGQRANVMKFPATRSPIVAVGFLGTVLLEAQKVTMACGYI